MASKNFSDYFADSFLQSFGLAQKAEQEKQFEKWKMAEEAKQPLNVAKQRELEARAGMYANGMPVYSVDPEGQLIPVGNVPKGSKVLSPAAMMTPEDKIQMAVKQAVELSKLPTADMKNSMVSTEQAGTLINDLRDQANSLVGGYPGMVKLGKAKLTRGQSNEDANYLTYVDTLPSSAVSFYRGVTGDTRLSDADAKARALPLLWHPSESDTVKAKKFDFLQRMIEARKNLLQSGKYKVDEAIPLSVLKKEAQKESTFPEFKTEDEAIKSGKKGVVIINGKKARID